MVDERDIVDAKAIVKWTGLSPKTVWSWIDREKLPALNARTSATTVLDWSVVRPILVELSRNLDRRPPSSWPEPAP